MGVWERKNLFNLAYAISNHLNKNENDERAYYESIQTIEKGISIGSLNISNPEPQLRSARLQVCEICRKYELYKCDVPEGWSSNCAFLKANT
jgi:hypothetical protein